jgi:pimeloyl-ACP methyl ester carboxylesterase
MTDSDPTSHWFTSHNLRLHYVDWGNPDAEPLVLVHGGRDHCRSWDWVAAGLREDFHIVAPDLRGHGQSDYSIGSSYPMIDFVYDLRRLLRELGDRPVSIVAHSFGGVIALLFAGIYPDLVKRIVVIEGTWLLDPAIHAPERIPVTQRIATWAEQLDKATTQSPRSYPTVEAAVERMMAEHRNLSPEQARHLTIHGLRKLDDGTYTWSFDPVMRLLSPTYPSQADVTQIWSQVAAPALSIRGTLSPHSDPNELGVPRLFQDMEAVNVENAGHWAHHDQLDEVMGLIRPFLLEGRAEAASA